MKAVNPQKTHHSSLPIFLTVKQFCEKHPFLSQDALRFHVFNGKTNGLEKSGAITRLGRKLLINEAKILEWVKSHGARGIPSAK